MSLWLSLAVAGGSGGGSGRDGRGAAADVVDVVVVAVAVAVGITDATQVSDRNPLEPKQLPPRSRTRRCGSPERSAPFSVEQRIGPKSAAFQN